MKEKSDNRAFTADLRPMWTLPIVRLQDASPESTPIQGTGPRA